MRVIGIVKKKYEKGEPERKRKKICSCKSRIKENENAKWYGMGIKIGKDICIMLKLCKNWNKITSLVRIMLINGNN